MELIKATFNIFGMSLVVIYIYILLYLKISKISSSPPALTLKELKKVCGLTHYSISTVRTKKTERSDDLRQTIFWLEAHYRSFFLTYMKSMTKPLLAAVSLSGSLIALPWSQGACDLIHHGWPNVANVVGVFFQHPWPTVPIMIYTFP